MAAVDHEKFKQPLNNETLQELCQHINKKHRVSETGYMKEVSSTHFLKWNFSIFAS